MWSALHFALCCGVLAVGAEDNVREARRTYQIEVPGKDAITIIEDDAPPQRWADTVNIDKSKDKFPDVTIDHTRCFGPSCREDIEEALSPPDHLEEFLLEYADKVQGAGGDPKERLQAISSLASKLQQRDRIKGNRYGNEEEESPFKQSWNKLKVKQHKHPYDDRDGWVTMEAVPYSTSKVSKWRPNPIRSRPNHWDDDTPETDRYPTTDNYPNTEKIYNYDKYNSDKYNNDKYTTDKYNPDKYNIDKYITEDDVEDYKKPTKRPTIIVSRPHYNSDWNEPPTKPLTQQASYPSNWANDDSRRPHKNCDSDRHPHEPSEVYYGMTDSIITDDRHNYPYEYQALKKPQRPTQVVYADVPERRPSHPSSGEGQWILLSTTKGYRSKKRPRAMALDSPAEDGTVTSHHTVGLTVLPRSDSGNTTTSHGGLLEVERSFQTVEESKRDMEKAELTEVEQIESPEPAKKKRLIKKIVTPAMAVTDGASVLAAVGAGMLPATMAMVVPMMLGKRRRRRDLRQARLHPLFLKYY